MDQLTPFQQDLVTLRLDPTRPKLKGARELNYLIGKKKWPGHGGDDHRPQGWGWKQVQAYGQVFRHLQQKQHNNVDILYFSFPMTEKSPRVKLTGL